MWQWKHGLNGVKKLWNPKNLFVKSSLRWIELTIEQQLHSVNLRLRKRGYSDIVRFNYTSTKRLGRAIVSLRTLAAAALLFHQTRTQQQRPQHNLRAVESSTVNKRMSTSWGMTQPLRPVENEWHENTRTDFLDIFHSGRSRFNRLNDSCFSKRKAAVHWFHQNNKRHSNEKTVNQDLSIRGEKTLDNLV